MASEFLDANVILRYILQDHPDFSLRAKQLFADLSAGRVALVTSEAVITEVVQVLSSRNLYGFARLDIQNQLQVLLGWPSLEIAYRESVLRALDIYAAVNIDFVDALSVAQMEREEIKTIISFDRDFDKINSIKRREP